MALGGGGGGGGGGGSIGEVEDSDKNDIVWTAYNNIVFPFNLMVKKKLCHGGKGFTFPMLNATFNQSNVGWF